jgi:hypothetical protein
MPFQESHSKVLHHGRWFEDPTKPSYHIGGKSVEEEVRATAIEWPGLDDYKMEQVHL